MSEISPTTAAGAPPKDAGALLLLLVAVLFSLLVVAASLATLWQLRDVLIGQAVHQPWMDWLLGALAAAALALFAPNLRALIRWSASRRAFGQKDWIAQRIALSGARHSSWIALGYGATVLLSVALAAFVMANDLKVGDTFFSARIFGNSTGVVLEAFWYNIMIFMIAEALVLVWGLVVAIGRLLPGPAGAPVRFLAALYCDVFRGLPSIIVIYLIGFGLPLTGIQFFRDIPVVVFPILALTLTYGAYVAEVYRAGIQSIHWSQMAAARSLGLSYLQSLRYVIVPQAVRRITPPLLNDFIGLQKDTALVSVIGTIDAFNQARIIATNHFNLSGVTIVALIFLVITIPQARLVDHLIDRDQRRMRPQG